MKTKGYRPSAPLPHERTQAPQGAFDQLEDGATQGAQALAVRSAVIVDRGAAPAALMQPAGLAGARTSDDSAWLAWSQQTLVLQTETSDVELPVPLALYRLCLAWVERREARALDPQDGRVLIQVQGAAAQGVPGLVELLSAMFRLHLAELPRQAMRIVREHATQAAEPAAAPAAAKATGSPQHAPQGIEPVDDGEGAERAKPRVSQALDAPERTPPFPAQSQVGDPGVAEVPGQEDPLEPETPESSAPPTEPLDVLARESSEAAEPRRERAADRRRRRGPPID